MENSTKKPFNHKTGFIVAASLLGLAVLYIVADKTGLIDKAMGLFSKTEETPA